MLLIIRTKLNCVKFVSSCEKCYVNINVITSYLYTVDIELMIYVTYHSIVHIVHIIFWYFNCFPLSTNLQNHAEYILNSNKKHRSKLILNVILLHIIVVFTIC